MSWLGMLEDLASVGLSEAKIMEAVADSPEAKAITIRTAEQAKATWLSVWDEMGPHPWESGAYRASINVTYETGKHGELIGKVGSKRRDAVWIEYGTIHQKEFAPARKTIAMMGGEQSGATSAKQGHGNTGSVS